MRNIIAFLLLALCPFTLSANDFFGDYQYTTPGRVAETAQGNTVALDRLLVVFHLDASISQELVYQLAKSTQSSVLGRVSQANGYVFSVNANDLEELVLYMEHYKQFAEYVNVVVPDVIVSQ
ncbi:hypothetical protein [Motilimonas eburnea]|uniref:hypothetical protein n=1 Tax=Motilimonas eburnea TaxID=1737488 RepID=UPI001E4828F0|nr:hypothetical protein [Motilimonas eburnea]MCE2571734.1 hypothetical protein [Motilimonas eburnea]